MTIDLIPTPHMLLDGIGDYATTADKAGLSFSGAMEGVALITPGSLTLEQTIFGKWEFVAPPTSIFAEDWAGANNDAWDAGRWPSIELNSLTAINIQNNRGVGSGDGNGGIAASAASTHTDGELRWDTYGHGGSAGDAFIYVCLRSSGDFNSGSPASRPTDCYYVRTEAIANSTCTIFSRLNNSEVSLGTLTQAGSVDQSWRFQIIGNELKVKNWDKALAEPGTWDFETTTSVVNTPGVLQFTWRNGPLIVEMDDLILIDTDFTA